MLSTLDVGVFGFYMLLLVGIGVYFTRQQKGLKSYLLADQNIHWIIVAISVLAALFSGISYLGAPAETYYNDLSYLWVVVSFFIATPITTLVFLPFFRRLNLYTAYEYLERRFDRRLRWLASGLFIVRVTFYLALAVYAPALAIMEITGWPLWLSASLTGLAATLYTTLGGMKAVIWTDSLQFLVLCGGIVLILAFAIAGVPGGLPAAWHLAAEKGKIEFIHLDLDPTVRVTVWAALLGGACNNLVQMVTDQISVQRYLTAKSLEECQRALWFKLGVTLPLVGTFYLTGTVLFGYYQAYPDREPVATAKGHVVARAEWKDSEPPKPLGDKERDRLLPFFVVRHLPSPLPGLLIAAVFGATMAVVSAGINALATATLMDFGPGAGEPRPSERRQFLQARALTVVFGGLATALALVVGMLGTLVEATVQIMGLFGGPLLGIFFLGVLSRRANGNGALVGVAVGAVAGILVAFSRFFLPKPISFLWTAFAAAGTTFVVGWVSSLLFPAPPPSAQELVFWKGEQSGFQSQSTAPG
ncbi:MAG: sodium/solute symporter [Planctomycetes bacterium]|nr:sodium/solute symporter [Planctomycetota bacterium]